MKQSSCRQQLSAGTVARGTVGLCGLESGESYPGSVQVDSKRRVCVCHRAVDVNRSS